MRNLVCGLVLLFMVGACSDREAATFGRSYDECILKNARTGGDVESRETASTICQRHFERAPTAAEKKELQPGVTVRFDQKYYGRIEDNILVSVDNYTRNLVVVEVEVQVVFMDRARNENGDWPEDAEIVETLIWNLNPVAQPKGMGSALGTFTGNRAPSRHFVKRIRITRVLPLS